MTGLERIFPFFKPTILKLAFIVEWTLFILYELIRGAFENGHQLMVALYPLAIFYLVACGLTELNHKMHKLSSGCKLAVIGLGLTIVDQICKTLVVGILPDEASFPIIHGWLHLANQRNALGSWVAETFTPGVCSPILLIGLVVCVLPGSWFCYRYYITNQRQSLWADIAFLGVFAGSASWLIDMGLRGSIVDFIRLPGVVTADFKDILITVGVGAFFAESIDNPNVSIRWKGWRTESKELQQLTVSLLSFSVVELRRIRHALQGVLGKGSES